MNLKLEIDPHDICRICMSQTNNLLNYFSNIVVDGYVIAVPDMVMKCLDIESDVNDGLPDKICDVCKKQITMFHFFKEKSIRTEQILLTALNKPFRERNTKTIPNEVKPQTSTVAIQTMPEELFSCMECKYFFKTENLLSKHISSKHYTIKIDAHTQADDIGSIRDENFIEEMPESIEVDSKQEMKMEVLEMDDCDIEELDMDNTYEDKTDTQLTYEIFEKIQDEYQCNDCLKTFEQIDSFRHHKCPNKVVVHIVHEQSSSLGMDELSENYYDELIPEIDSYECIRCQANFANIEDYTTHRNNNECEEIPYKCKSPKIMKMEEEQHCNVCHKRFKSTTSFIQHQKLHESIEAVIDYLDCAPCDDCHRIFLLEKQLDKHNCPKKKKNADDVGIDESCTDYQYLEQDSDFLCDVCSLEFASLTSAKQHVITHLKQFVCPFDGCGCSYEIWSRFAMHINMKHLNAERHQCRFCDTECDSFDTLQAHYKNVCREKKYKCDHCEKSYFSQKALNLHIKDVTKGKTFSCSVCSKSFNRRGELDLHIRSHTNVRPYTCTICGKAYKTSSMRAAHMDAHIEGKTFPCTLCDKKLQTRTSYRNHMKRHTEEKKHQCEKCGKKFFTKFHVKLHASKVHERSKVKSIPIAPNMKFEYEDIIDSLDDDQAVTPFQH